MSKTNSKAKSKKINTSTIVENAVADSIELSAHEVSSVDAEIAALMQSADSAEITETTTDSAVTSILNKLQSQFDNVRSVLSTKNASAVQFEREFKRLTNARVLSELVKRYNVSESFFSFVDNFNNEYLAVYALEKVNDYLRAACELQRNIDSYSSAIIRNALQLENNSISYDQCAASICASLTVHDSSKLKVRLHKAASTANAQRSSTKNALLALNIAEFDADTETLKLKTDSAMMKTLLSHTMIVA